MEKFLVSLFCLVFVQTRSQDIDKARTEISVFGVQTGFLGFWAHHEWGITESIAIRTEVGWDAEIIFRDESLIFAPVISLEPRHYYNLLNRQKKGNRTDGNSGNYYGFVVAHHFDKFIISRFENASIIPNLNVYGKWGFRRSIGKHFNYEFGVGYGFIHNYYKSKGFQSNTTESQLFLDFKFGYRF